LQFVHAETVNLLDTITLGLDEMIASVDTVSFAGDPTLYVAVGTAVVLPSEPEPTRGQIRLLEPCQSSSSNEVALPPFRVVNTLEVSGAVYALHAFQGRLLGAVNNRLLLWDLKKDPDYRLVEVCRYSAGVIVMDLQSMGHQILVGDIMRSVTLIQFDPEELSFEMVAFDETSAWSMTVDMLSDNHFLCADDAGNLLSLSCGVASRRQDASKTLERVGRIHTGEFMNRFRRAKTSLGPTLWASASGAFGWVMAVDEQRFFRLLKLQEFMGKELKPMLSYQWRDRLDLQGFSHVEHEGFLNGNLLARYLKMPEMKQQELAQLLLDEGFSKTESPREELLEDLEMLSPVS